MKFRKKPVVVEAVRWTLDQNDPDVRPWTMDLDHHCESCSQSMSAHGMIETLEGCHIVCLGDWIITGINGERYPCKPDIFAATYELISDPSPESSKPKAMNVEQKQIVREAIETVFPGFDFDDDGGEDALNALCRLLSPLLTVVYLEEKK